MLPAAVVMLRVPQLESGRLVNVRFLELDGQDLRIHGIPYGQRLESINHWLVIDVRPVHV